MDASGVSTVRPGSGCASVATVNCIRLLDTMRRTPELPWSSQRVRSPVVMFGLNHASTVNWSPSSNTFGTRTKSVDVSPR